jgi:hypothetical protein
VVAWTPASVGIVWLQRGPLDRFGFGVGRYISALTALFAYPITDSRKNKAASAVDVDLSATFSSRSEHTDLPIKPSKLPVPCC